MIDALVVGAGSIGTRHIRNLISLGNVRISVLRRQNQPVPGFPDLKIWTDLDEALNACPDFLVITTPAPFHISTAIKAVEAGIPCFIEKPLSNSLSQARKLASLAKKKNVLIYVGYDFRFDPGLILIKQAVKTMKFGRLLSVSAHVGQYLPQWRPDQDYRSSITANRNLGGGVILELIHELDFLLWIAGSVNQVGCFAGNVSDLEMDTEDLAIMILAFENGVLGTVHLDCVDQASNRTCRWIFEKGSLCWEPLKNSLVFVGADGDQERLFEDPFRDRNQRFLDEIKHFIDCLSCSSQSKSPLHEALQSLELAMAAIESAQKNQFIQLKGKL